MGRSPARGCHTKIVLQSVYRAGFCMALVGSGVKKTEDDRVEVTETEEMIVDVILKPAKAKLRVVRD